VAENYLPEELRGRQYYEPSTSGRERDIGVYLAGLRKTEQ
jgi:putative ATPase